MLALHQHDAPAATLARLRGLSLFTGLSDAELRRVDTLTCDIEVPAGAVLMRQGQVGREVFVVATGVADVAVDDRTIARVGTGEPLGELAILDRAPRAATVTALTPMHVLVMTPGQFEDLLDNPRISRTIAEVQSRRHRGIGGAAPRIKFFR